MDVTTIIGGNIDTAMILNENMNATASSNDNMNATTIISDCTDATAIFDNNITSTAMFNGGTDAPGIANSSITTTALSHSESYIFSEPSFHFCLSIVVISGCVLNALVMAAIVTDVKMRKRENMLHFNLSCIDTLLLIVASWPMIITHIESAQTRTILQGIHCFLFISLCITNFFALITIAVSRVKRFTQYDYQLSKRQLGLAIFFSWFLGGLVGFSRILTSFNLPVCGNIVINLRYIPLAVSRGFGVIFFVIGIVILIGTYIKCVVFLLKLKNIHPTAGPNASATFNAATNEVTLAIPARRVSVSAIFLDIFQATSEPVVETRERPVQQPSPHFRMRRHLVVTSFILLTCSIALLLIPMVIAPLMFNMNIGLCMGYVSITLNSCLTPLIYIWRYNHFRTVVVGWFKKLKTACSCNRRVDIEQTQ